MGGGQGCTGVGGLLQLLWSAVAVALSPQEQRVRTAPTMHARASSCGAVWSVCSEVWHQTQTLQSA